MDGQQAQPGGLGTGEDGRAAWPIRPALLAAIGGASALLIQQLLTRGGSASAERVAIVVALGTAVFGFGFVAERLRLAWAVGFALAVGAVAGLLVYWQNVPGHTPDFWDWRMASLFLAIAIAAPLFQTARDEGGWRFPYAALHGHAWTNVVLWFAGWAFVGIVFALAWLLAALFALVKLDFLEKLLQKEWLIALLMGIAYGGAIGMLRERDGIVRLLQRVVTAVLGVLAPVLGIGLLAFLAVLPFTGLGALWEATRSTTPILLSCVIGALVLANAVIGNGTDDEARHPVLRWGAMALAAVMLPLAVIAAVATGLRIDQHGFTPDRLWALTFVILASAYGLAYLVALGRGRGDWARHVRPANTFLACAVAAVALFLATPILSFNVISTADQVARLTSGRVKPDKFDWAALAFDFGDPGRAALKRLAGSRDAAIAKLAKAASETKSRYKLAGPDGEKANRVASLEQRLRVLPRPVALPDALKQRLADWEGCPDTNAGKCVLVYTEGSDEAFLLREACIKDLAARRDLVPVIGSACGPTFLARVGDEWQVGRVGARTALTAEQRAALTGGFAQGAIEVRTVPRRQIFVGGVPVGDPFE